MLNNHMTKNDESASMLFLMALRVFLRNLICISWVIHLSINLKTMFV